MAAGIGMFFAVALMVALLGGPTILYGAFVILCTFFGGVVPLYMLWVHFKGTWNTMVNEEVILGGFVFTFPIMAVMFFVLAYGGMGFPAENHLQLLIRTLFEHPFAVHPTPIVITSDSGWFLQPTAQLVWNPLHFIQVWLFLAVFDLFIMWELYHIGLNLALEWAVQKPIAILITKILGLKRLEPEAEEAGSPKTTPEAGEAMAT